VSATGGRSKLLLDVGGVTVLERNLRWLARSGITSVWINLHYRPDDIKAVVGDGARLGMAVRYKYEPELLGTAGAYRALAGSRTGTALVMCGDNVASFDLRRLLERHRNSGAVATIAVFDPTRNANSGVAGGRVAEEAGRVTGFIEGAGVGPEWSMVNAGVYALEPAALQHIPMRSAPDFGRDVFPSLLAAGAHVAACSIEPEGYCFGLDTPESLERTLAAFRTGRRKDTA
jgi:NDP-sugar pyrophosphorylase family protein